LAGKSTQAGARARLFTNQQQVVYPDISAKIYPRRPTTQQSHYKASHRGARANNTLMQPMDAYRNSGLINLDYPDNDKNNNLTSNSVMLDRSSNISTYEKNADQKSLNLEPRP